MTSQQPNVTFEASIAMSGSSLDVEYVLANRTGDTVYVFDRPTRFDDNGDVLVEPDRMFVLLDRDVVRLLHVVIPTPKIRAVRRRPPVYASPVAPRAEHRRKIKLALPLDENQQFFSADRVADARAVTVRRARVVVGWIDNRAGLQVARDETPQGIETNVYGGWGLPLQWLSTVEASTPAIDVFEHPPPFERFPKLD